MAVSNATQGHGPPSAPKRVAPTSLLFEYTVLSNVDDVDKVGREVDVSDQLRWVVKQLPRTCNRLSQQLEFCSLTIIM